MRVASAHRETIAATECLLQRVEQARAAGWGTITSASGIQNQILNTPAGNAGALAQMQEQITVYPYPQLTPAPTPLVVVRDPDGSERVISQPASGLDLRSFLAVRVDLQLTWQSSVGARQRVRQLSTVIAVDALLK